MTTADRASNTARAVDDFQSIAAEAGRIGVSLAGRIASEFSKLVPEPGQWPIPTGGDPAEMYRSLRSAQLDVERSVGAVLDILGQSIDSYAALAEAALSTASSGSHDTVESVKITAAPDSTTTHELWIHNTTDRQAEALVVNVTAPLSHDLTAPRLTVEVDGAQIDTLPAGESVAVGIRLHVPAGQPPGAHHSMVLVDGVPDAVVHLLIDIAGPAAPERDEGVT